MATVSKWALYDVARNRLLMQIGELDRVIYQEQSKASPDDARILWLNNEQDALIAQSDMLGVDDLELTSRIASPEWKCPIS